MSMSINEAKLFIVQLHADGLLYHFEDRASDCLDGKTDHGRICRIQRIIDDMYIADLDWGRFECPIGYALMLINTEA